MKHSNILLYSYTKTEDQSWEHAYSRSPKLPGNCYDFKTMGVGGKRLYYRKYAQSDDGRLLLQVGLSVSECKAYIRQEA